MRCACWRRRGRHCWPPASAIRRRIPWSIAPPGARGSCCRTAPGSAERIATLRTFCDERSFDVSWYPGMDPAAARAQHLQRPAGGFVRQRRGRPPTARTTPSPTRRDAVLADAADAVASGLQPGADHPGPAVLLCRAAAGSARHDPEAAGDPAAGRDRRAGQSRRAGPGGGDRGPGAAGAAGSRRAGCACRRSGLLRPIVYFPALGLGFLFIEIFLIEKASLWLNDRTSRLRPGADRNAGVLRAGQHDRATDLAARTPRGAASRWRAWRERCLAWCAACCVIGCAAASCFGNRSALPWLARVVLRPGRAGAGIAGARPAVPAGPDAHRHRRVSALGLGAERRLLRGRDATRQPDCARGRVQPGSALRRGAVCDRAGDVSRSKEEPRVAALSARSRAAE